MDLNNFSRKDATNATVTYYGYTKDLDALDGDFSWTIRKVTEGTSSVNNVSWSNGVTFYDSSWSGRTYSFVAPSGSLGLTWSIDSDNDLVNCRWNALNGVNYYKITAINDANNVLNPNGYITYNTYNSAFTAIYVNNYYHPQYVRAGYTYSIVLEASNVVGTLLATASRIYMPAN